MSAPSVRLAPAFADPQFSFLLILCDDAQEWGRKSITELHTKPSNTYTFESIECALDGEFFECKFKDKYQVNSESAKQVLDSFKRQSKIYINIFRDGQDTVSRNFNFTRQVEIAVIGGNNVNYLLKLMVTTEEQTKIVITKTDGEPLEKKDIMQQLISDIFDKEHPILSEDNKTLILVL
ncbi:hypothetical protein [Phocaeicola sp.]|uniref:hypothetical protein n=1 Tax=Phocaeicola sp. TaxID=2773926 RepID=UPI003AB1C780